MSDFKFVKKALMAASATVMTLVSGQAAQAVTFDFSGASTESSSLEFSEEGITVTATAFDETDSSRAVLQRPLGLGVRPDTLFGFLDDPEIDGVGSDETLQLAFDQDIRLVAATFSRVGFNDDFRLIVDGDELVSADIPGGGILDFGIGTFDFTSFALPDRTGSVLGFTVTESNDDYFLRSIEVEPVPEPLTILGSLSALGLGTVLKKKQQQKG